MFAAASAAAFLGIHGGFAVADNALRIDTGNVPTSGSGPVSDVQYAVTRYGPAFSLTFHWSDK